MPAPITSTHMTGAATRTALVGVVVHRPDGSSPLPANVSASPVARSAYVAVSVATVWTTPQSPRPVDHPALTNPVDIRGWLSAMTPAQQEALTSDDLDQTQALFGDRVIVVREQGDWDQVLVPGQPTPKDSQGYPGWIPKAQLTSDPGYGALKERSLRAGRSRHHHLAVPRTRTLRSGPRDQHQHPASRPEPHRQRRSGGHPGSGPEVAGCSNGDGLRKAHGHTASQRSRSGPVCRRVRERPLPVGRPGRVRVGLLRFHLHDLPDARHHPAARCRTASRRQPRPRDRQIRVATRRSALLLAQQKTRTRSTTWPCIPATANMIEAFETGTPVRITPARLDADYWGARRYLG